MPESDGLTTTQRIGRLFEHLGIERAHFGVSLAAEIAGWITRRPETVASLTLVNPLRLPVDAVRPFAGRTAVFVGDTGMAADAVRAADDLDGARITLFEGYEAVGWSDIVADHVEAIAGGMADLLDDAAEPAATVLDRDGEHGDIAGLAYRISGTGPAVVLFPIMLAPSQWEPVAELLAARYSVVTLGGATIGAVALLEARADDPSYRRVLGTMLDEARATPADRLVEIGCGPGTVARWLAGSGRVATPVTAIDLNPFLLHEARALAERAGLSAAIEFREGNAEAIPLPDASFDIAFSITVMEECDAARMAAEMARVVRPGGRVVVAVRAGDMPVYWHLDLDPEILAKVNVPYDQVSPKGCADGRLVDYLIGAGLEDVRVFPQFHGVQDTGHPLWRFYEPLALGALEPAERTAWAEAKKAAEAAGTAFFVHPLHCAVGTRPA